MPVGSTNTIIYSLYKENNIEIPENIAGLMLSGILSDTLIFKSPTTTLLDREAVYDLEKIAKVDASKYGIEMLKSGSSLKGKTLEEIGNMYHVSRERIRQIEKRALKKLRNKAKDLKIYLKK